MKRYLSLAVALAAVVGWAACGGSSGGSPDVNPSITSLDELPKATDPVQAETTSMIVAPLKSLFKGAGENGYKLSQLSADIFSLTDATLGDSRSACELSNVMKQTFNAGAVSDKMQCYVAQTYGASDRSIDIYKDGSYVFGLVPAAGEAENTPKHVKMKFVMSGTSIKTFQMWTCSDKKSNGGTLKEYVYQNIDGDGIVIDAIGSGMSGDARDSWERVHVEGKLNSDNQFIEKSIRVYSKNKMLDDSFQNWSEGLLQQFSSYYDFMGYQKGLSGAFTYGNKVYAKGQLTNPTAVDGVIDMRDTVIGMGALKAVLEEGGGTSVDGDPWDKDFRREDTNAYVEDVRAGLLPGDTGAAIEAPPATYDELVMSFDDISEAGDYDCSEDELMSLNIPADLDSGACAPYTLGYDWINCYDILQEDINLSGNYSNEATGVCAGTIDAQITMEDDGGGILTGTAESGAVVTVNYSDGEDGTPYCSSIDFAPSGGVPSFNCLVCSINVETGVIISAPDCDVGGGTICSFTMTKAAE